MSDIFKTGFKQDRAWPEGSINCDYVNCYAGEGVAGMGMCFLNGDPTRKGCPNFSFEEIELVSFGNEIFPIKELNHAN